jgi:hypothetical protein
MKIHIYSVYDCQFNSFSISMKKSNGVILNVNVNWPVNYYLFSVYKQKKEKPGRCFLLGNSIYGQRIISKCATVPLNKSTVSAEKRHFSY